MCKCVPADPKCQYSIWNMCKWLCWDGKLCSRIRRQCVLRRNCNISVEKQSDEGSPAQLTQLQIRKTTLQRRKRAIEPGTWPAWNSHWWWRTGGSQKRMRFSDVNQINGKQSNWLETRLLRRVVMWQGCCGRTCKLTSLRRRNKAAWWFAMSLRTSHYATRGEYATTSRRLRWAWAARRIEILIFH